MNNNSPSNIESWAEWFDRRAQYYNDPLAKIAYYVDGKLLPFELMERTLKDAFNKLQITSNCNLLDVGGGVGLFARAFGPKLKRVITTDISFAMAKDGSNLIPDDSFIVTAAAFLPFKSYFFERLLCYSVFQYFQDLCYAQEVLAEFIRVVKKGGFILIGDIPLEAQQKNEIKKQDNKRDKIQKPHYPHILKHDLNMLEFKTEFFIKFCNENNVNCKVLKQNIEGKPSSINRYDVLIEV